jgi:hypothetical protein
MAVLSVEHFSPWQNYLLIILSAMTLPLKNFSLCMAVICMAVLCIDLHDNTTNW